MKMEVNVSSIVKLNQVVKARFYEYKMSCFNLEREIVCAVYIKDLLEATESEGKRKRLNKKWDKYYDKSFIFRLMPCLGNIFFVKISLRNFLV